MRGTLVEGDRGEFYTIGRRGGIFAEPAEGRSSIAKLLAFFSCIGGRTESRIPITDEFLV